MSGVFNEGESSEDSSSSDDSSHNESGSEESKEASAGDNDFSSENEDSDAMLEEWSLNRTVTNRESLGDTQTILDRFLSVGSGPGLQRAGDRTGKFNLQLIIYNLQFTGESDNERIE